ncbi:hypothetical protein MASR1M12_11250 [Erysipelotrichia bacterium]
MKDYHINLFSEEDEGYIADIPDLTVSISGHTPSEALLEVLKAKEAWIRTAQDKNALLPNRNTGPAIYKVA